jgi:hypothetical protein
MSKDIINKSKKTLCIQLPLKMALWGAGSWTLTANNKRKLESFHHESIRRVLNASTPSRQKWEESQAQNHKHKGERKI